MEWFNEVVDWCNVFWLTGYMFVTGLVVLGVVSVMVGMVVRMVKK